MSLHTDNAYILVDNRDGKIVFSANEEELVSNKGIDLTINGSGADYTLYSKVMVIGNERKAVITRVVPVVYKGVDE